jgi:hypothetical protein
VFALLAKHTRCSLARLLTHRGSRRAELTPGVRVFYAVGNADGPKSAEWSFVPPPAPDAGATLRFLVAADMGVAEVDGSNWDDSRAVAPLVEISLRGWDNRPAANTTQRLAEEVEAGAQLLLLNGDISYARGFAAVWESYLDALQPVAARVPMMTVPGNHESCWPGTGSAWNTSSLDSGGECGLTYTHRFPMPAPATYAAPWYSFDAGPVHFTHISTEHALGAGSPQLAWLAADLAAASAAGLPWKVLSAHRFFYVDSSTVRCVARRCRSLLALRFCTLTCCMLCRAQLERDAASGRALLDGGLEELLLQHSVDLTLTGHHHSYQRASTCAYWQRRCKASRQHAFRDAVAPGLSAWRCMRRLLPRRQRRVRAAAPRRLCGCARAHRGGPRGAPACMFLLARLPDCSVKACVLLDWNRALASPVCRASRR